MKNEKKINLGFAILRLYLSFLVVIHHCFQPSNIMKTKFKIKIIFNIIHVPNFYLLSFYFCYNLFKSKNIRKIKIRFQRLLIPYFIWPIIIWSLKKLLSFLYKKIQPNTFKELIFQFLTGHVFMTVLWFQYELIFITLLMFIIHLLFKENLVMYILINVQVFAIFFTYSNYNFIYFNKYNYFKKNTFGRFFEIIPYCITGYILAYLNSVNFLSKHRKISLNIFLPVLILISKYKIFLELSGFAYQGLKLYTLSISIFFLFSLVPTERIGNKNTIKFIEFISGHTAGIYFIHLPLSYYFYIFSLVKRGKLSGAVIIYIVSYIISLLGKLQFKKTKLINLFQ